MSGLGQVMDAHLDVMASRDRGDQNAPTAIHLAYTTVRQPFWEGLAACLGVLSADATRSNLLRRSAPTTTVTAAAPLDIIHLVASHLSDPEPHLLPVLTCFRLLLDRLGSHVWSTTAGAQEDRYEEVVLHAILSNPTFESTFTSPSSLATSPNEQAILDWLPPFLVSVKHSSNMFTNSLAIISSTFLDQLQHLRFEVAARSRAIELALNILTDVFVSSSSLSLSSIDLQPQPPKWPHAPSTSKIIDLHSPLIARLAFDPRYGAEEWREAREAARMFVGRVLERDSKRVRDGVYALGLWAWDVEEARRKSAKAKPGEPKVVEPPAPAPLTICTSLWTHSYSTLPPSSDDLHALSILLRSTTSSSHLEKLSSRVWSLSTSIRPQMKTINLALDTSRDPLQSLLIGLADEPPETLRSFLALPAVAEHLSILLLSPLDQLHATALGLIKNSYDASTRRDSFRALIFDHPDATLRGLYHGIRAFVKSAKVVPEATGMAKRVVRCLSDVIDVLCAATDGLLRDQSFGARIKERGEGGNWRTRLSQLWRIMCEALALLFKKTPGWAMFFENEKMTEWMRDAVLFGVDLVEQVRTFETAITGRSLSSTSSSSSQPPPSPTKTSSTATSMIAAMNDPLEELMAWLRLNDEDLLNSAFNLVRAMLARFARSDVPLRPTTSAKIRKIASKGQAERDKESRSCILREDQLRELIESLEANEGEVSGKERRERESKESHKEWWEAAQKAAKGKGKGGKVEMIQIDSDDDKPRKSVKKGPTSTSSSARPSSRPSAPFPSSSSKFGTWTSASTPIPFGKSSSTSSRTSLTKSSLSSKAAPTIRNAARPRGVPWTTYTSKPAAESSDESSDDDDDDEGGSKLTGLALLAQAQKGEIKIKKQTERRSVKMVEVDSAGRASKSTAAANNLKAKQEALHAANAARLRGTQDYSQLHRQILQWDSNHDGPLPPSMRTDLRQIATSFASPEDYVAAFEPLLLAECWEQLRTAKVEAAKENQIIPCTIAGRQAVDDFTDVFLTVEHGQMPDKMWISESDLVLLRQGRRMTLAKVQSFKKTREFSEITLRCHLGTDVTEAGPGLSPRTKWEMVKLYRCARSLYLFSYTSLTFPLPRSQPQHHSPRVLGPPIGSLPRPLRRHSRSSPPSST